jgi:hypothetical protein
MPAVCNVLCGNNAPATARITAKCPGGGVSQEFSITNAEYWAKVEASTTGYAEEVTFVVKDCGHTVFLPLVLNRFP